MTRIRFTEYLSFYRNFIDTALMPAALKIGIEKSLHNATSRIMIDKATRHDTDIGIVVPAGELGQFGRPAEGRTDTLVFIERHGDAVAAAAECDAHGQFALLDGACEGMGRIGIIETFGARSSEIIHFVSFAFEVSDEEFLHRYCIGYDGATMPAGAPASESYRAYVLGEGPDGVAKTPQWAARITGCPSARIASFARELAGARRAFIMQGWGPQRTALGEQSARAICLLSLLTGNFGLPGTNRRPRAAFPACPSGLVPG